MRNDMPDFAYSSFMKIITRSVTSRMDFGSSAKLFIKAVLRHMGYSISEDSIKLVQVRHHLSHAASAYYYSGHKNALAMVIDGQGEKDSTTAWSIHDGEFENIFSQEWNSLSLGYLYEYVSKYLGFSRQEGPGKVMGLAPYGSMSNDFYNRLEKLLKRSKFGYSISSDFTDATQDSMYEGVAKYLSGSKNPISTYLSKNKLNKKACDYAYTLQLFFERMIIQYANDMKSSSGQTDAVLAGGSALNAKANMELYYSKTFNDLFIFPAATDSGGSIGAATYAYSMLFKKINSSKLSDIYLGDIHDGEEVNAAVKRSKLKADYIGGETEQLAKSVAKGGTLAFYNGRSELGPRALGNRSIVADPRKKENWERLNAIKGREWWRPLAPSVLDKRMGNYFVYPTNHEFMVLMFHTTNRTAESAPAVNHIDMTARPQSVSSKTNKLWYKLINSFEKETGEGIVINTSFNNAGEPLVETPEQAIRSFAASGLDLLYLQGWLLSKK